MGPINANCQRRIKIINDEYAWVTKGKQVWVGEYPLSSSLTARITIELHLAS